MSSRRRDPVYARQGGRKVHVVAGGFASSLGRGECGAELWGDEYLAHMVPPEDRCRKPQCAAAWPAHLRPVR